MVSVQPSCGQVTYERPPHSGNMGILSFFVKYSLRIMERRELKLKWMGKKEEERDGKQHLWTILLISTSVKGSRKQHGRS